MKKNEKGIALVSFLVVVSIMTIIASTVVYISLDRFEINSLKKMSTDIELLQDKVSNYYLKYGVLPVLRNNTNEAIKYDKTLDFEKNILDNGTYYILDLEAMEGISLNYGEEGFKESKATQSGNIISNDVYIINQQSHTVYYVKGMELNGELYHSLALEDTSISDTIPPSNPKIKVISGTKLESKEGNECYVTDVEIEIIPGKDGLSGVQGTQYSLDNGNTWKELGTSSNIYTLSKNGIYTIKAKSYDNGSTPNYSLEEVLTIEIDKNKQRVFDLITANNYGDQIIYSAGNETDWNVFYKDDTHLYIITSYYMNNANLPTGLRMSGSSTYGVFWSDANAFTSTGASTITQEVAEKYNLSWLSDNTESIQENARATADLLNVNAWTAKFGDSSKGIEAIGSPTLEMWVNSWNSKGMVHGTDKYIKLKTEYNSTGYFIGPTSIENLIQDNMTNYNVGNTTDGYNDAMYFPEKDATDAYYGYTLASPSSAWTHRIMVVYDDRNDKF